MFDYIPQSLYGMPVYEVPDKIVPVLQISEDFKWLTDEARTKHNAYLLKTFGTRIINPIPMDRVFLWNNSIVMRPEQYAIIKEMVV